MDRKALRTLALVATAALFLAGGAVAQPFGAIDSPTEGQTVTGIVRVSGFVLDMRSVDKIEVLVDGVPANVAEMNLPRVDLLELFPPYAGSPTAQPGFQTSFLASNYSDGGHSVSIRVTESASQTQSIVATVNVVVDNTLNQAPFGNIDVPSAAGLTGANGSFQVIGWALDDVSIDHIDFLIDGQIVSGAVGNGQPSPAIYGDTRPDIQAAFPDVPNSLNSGFHANIDMTALVNGIHILSVVAWDNLGISRNLGDRSIQVINNGQNLGPFGAIDFPLDKAALLCTSFTDLDAGFPSPCTPELCGSDLVPNIVNGWAIDVGARMDVGMVAYLELLLDGQIVANTQSDCVQIGQSLQNCFGLYRSDVAREYTGYSNADSAGFNFTFFVLRNASGSSNVLALYLPTSVKNFPDIVGFTTIGHHTIAIRAGDVSETVTQFGAMSVDILCDQIDGDQPAFGYIDLPTNYQYINGSFQLFGWAVDIQGVATVEVDVDGQVVGDATYGVFRPDVPISDPRVQSNNTGFSFVLDTTLLSNSAHDIVIWVIDHRGNRTEIGRRKVVVNNNVSTHLRGFKDLRDFSADQ